MVEKTRIMKGSGRPMEAMSAAIIQATSHGGAVTNWKTPYKDITTDPPMTVRVRVFRISLTADECAMMRSAKKMGATQVIVA